MKKAAGARLPSFSSYESELVTGAFDFIGLNHYSSIYASNNPDVSKMPVRDQAADIGALFRGKNCCKLLHVCASIPEPECTCF
jgi:beta-glucosidase